ncbi:TPA: hypothetical protein N0F65_005034 [Lagenidium giganteum]|uniref:Uncharacterized protein n=1 Tax=Lagenidium giganteum TaxID=4803 RepID=A0AAV2ZI69_9STRA|nr:TPA: hypothetical protein N0F65_005034 [Lagenidium giganteum]
MDLVHLFPFSVTAPRTRWLRAEMQSKRELFPAPDGPIITSNSPGRAAPFTPLRIGFSSTSFDFEVLMGTLRCRFFHSNMICGESIPTAWPLALTLVVCTSTKCSFLSIRFTSREVTMIS